MSLRFVAGILQGALLLLQVTMCIENKIQIFRSGEIEIKETLIAVVYYSANWTVLAVQITMAKLGLT
jgi:hypothetical protein